MSKKDWAIYIESQKQVDRDFKEETQNFLERGERITNRQLEQDIHYALNELSN